MNYKWQHKYSKFLLITLKISIAILAFYLIMNLKLIMHEANIF